MAILTSSAQTFTNLTNLLNTNDIYIGDTAPVSPIDKQIWFNTGNSIAYQWDEVSSEWIIVNDYTDKIKDAIDGIDINSRNLLYDTAAAADVITNNTETVTVKLYELVNSIDYTKHIKGNTLTFAFDWEFIGTTPMGSFYIQTNGPQYTNLSKPIVVSNSSYYGTEKLVVTFDKVETFNSISMVATHNNGTIRISHARLLFGDKDLGWTQAPEDLVSKFETIFDRTAKGIYMQASGNGQTSLVNVDNQEVKIKSNNINIEGYTTINQHFKILPSGDLEAVNAKFTGTVDAFNINGANITGSVLTTGAKFSVNSEGILTAKDGSFTGDISASRIIGSTFTSANDKFKVLENGTIEAIDGNFKGSIKTGSTITGSEIIGSSIRNANSSFTVSTDGIITGASIKGGTIGIGNGTLYNAFTVDANGNVKISKGSIDIGSGAFTVSNKGALTATSADITGSINAGSSITGSNITGGTITGTALKGGTIGIGNGTAYDAFAVDVDGNVKIKKGSINISDNFIVENTGKVIANDLSITGGSLDIGNGNFTVSNAGVLTATGAVIAGNVTIITGSVPDSALSDTIKTGAENGTSALDGLNKLEIKFQERGGYNLLYNGNFKRDIEKWKITNDFSYIIGNGTWLSPDRCGVRITGKTGLACYLGQSITDSATINGSKYTLSGNVYISSSGENDTSGSNLQLYARITYSDGTMEYAFTNIDKTLYDKWQKVYVTFSRNTGKIATELRVNLSALNTTKHLYASQIMLETGEFVSSWSSNPNETYDGITTIDRDGITVTASNVKSKTSISADGFKITKTDTDQDIFKVNSDGTLSIIGDINAGSTITGATIKNATNTFSVSSDGVITGASITSGQISIGDNFSVSNTGVLTAKSANFTGTINSGSTISGATISGGSLDIGNGNFTVNHKGVLTATGAVITGSVTITSGSVPDSVLSSTVTSGAINGSNALTGLNNLEIGGRNLIIGSTKDFNTYSTGESFMRILQLTPLSELGLKPGDTITCRIYIKATDTMGVRARISYYYGADETSTTYKTYGGNIIALGQEGYSTVTTTLSADAIDKGLFVAIQKEDYNITTSALGEYKEAKLEKGNKATDWTPASEDILNSLADSEKAINDNIDGAVGNIKIDVLQSIGDKYTPLDEFNALSQTMSSKFEQTAKDMTTTFTTVNNYTKDIDGKLQDFQDTVESYIRFSANGIDLGKTNSPFTATLNNTYLAFRQDGETVAYISNNKMVITTADIDDELRIGDSVNGFFVWTQGNNGNLTLKWSDK